MKKCLTAVIFRSGLIPRCAGLDRRGSAEECRRASNSHKRGAGVFLIVTTHSIRVKVFLLASLYLRTGMKISLRRVPNARMLDRQIDSLKNSTGVLVKVAVQSSFSCVLPMSFDLLWLLYEGCQVLQLQDA